MRGQRVFICALALATMALAAGQPGRRTVSLVVLGGTVVTGNPARQVLTPGAVAIDGTDIIDVEGLVRLVDPSFLRQDELVGV
jgi:hypothetical protein